MLCCLLLWLDVCCVGFYFVVFGCLFCVFDV